MNNKISISLLFVSMLAQSAYCDEPSLGNYNVPVEAEELKVSSDYETYYNFKKDNDEITRIKYKLPLELSGEENEIDISYTGDAEFPWSGELAKGDCQESEGNFNCQLTYEKEKLKIDIPKTEAAIRTRFAGNEEEIQRRLSVSEIFRSEPAGRTSFPIQYAP